eukprot:118282_1
MSRSRSSSSTPSSSSPAAMAVADAALVEAKQHIKACRKLKGIGITNAKKITNTLQGSIWRTSQYPWSNTSCDILASVIKITNRRLHRHSLGVIAGTTFKVSEDILLEQSILKYLTEDKDCPKSIVRYYKFVQTSTDFFLVMEDGGSCLFDFVRDAHRLIRKRKIALSEWRKVVVIVFKQVIQCVDFIHSKNIVHFDLSLENLVVNDIKIELDKNMKTNKSRLRFVVEDIQVKLCDFGLAELFTKDKCLSSKHHGKKQYKSPEVIDGKRNFDGKLNDIWCVGVIIFMIATGCPPWDIASNKDRTYRYVMKKSIRDLLRVWKMTKYVDNDLIDLLEGIFKCEEERMCWREIKDHPFTLKAFQMY